MNKYQEALETLKFEVFEEGHCSYIEDEIKIAIEVLEKAIPKKLRITKGTGYKTYTCPICFACYANEGSFKFAQQRNKTYGSDSFCSRCGNALDWSESEEE